MSTFLNTSGLADKAKANDVVVINYTVNQPLLPSYFDTVAKMSTTSYAMYNSTELLVTEDCHNVNVTLEPQLQGDNFSTLSSLLDNNNLPNNSFSEDIQEYIFDRSDVRAIFLVLYTIVFCSCFFGNLMVILVVTLHWRMRSITNFCLANLAFADLCVGIFCVYQNIVTYLMESWVFGEFMCKMYHFINSLSTTASVLILVVICIERYLAIIHPMTCKQMLTLNRLRITIILVWIISAVISSPRFYYFSTFPMPLPDDKHEILCAPNRLKYNSKWMDIVSMTMLFLIPLLIISILYTQIGIALWKSSSAKMASSSATPSGESSSTNGGGCYREVEATDIHTFNISLLPVANPTLPQPQSLASSISCPLGLRSPAAQKREKKSILRSPRLKTAVTCCGKNNSIFCLSGGNKNGATSSTNPPSPFSNENCSCRNNSRSAVPAASCTTEPIVLVRFEQSNGLNHSGRSAQCTILMNNTNFSPEKCKNAINSNGNHGLDEVNKSTPLEPAAAQMSLKSRKCDAADCQICRPRLSELSPDIELAAPNVSPAPAPPKRLKRMRVVRSSKYGTGALQSRRRIIRMLIVVVLTFAVCHLPFHARKMWQYWSPAWAPYKAGGVFSNLFTPVTFLVMFANSGINPILYAFMSKKFRMSFRDLLCCKMRHSLKISRNASMKSTHVAALSQTGL